MTYEVLKMKSHSRCDISTCCWLFDRGLKNWRVRVHAAEDPRSTLAAINFNYLVRSESAAISAERRTKDGLAGRPVALITEVIMSRAPLSMAGIYILIREPMCARQPFFRLIRRKRSRFELFHRAIF